MLENNENDEYVKLTNSVEDIQCKDKQYFILQNEKEKENINENIINNSLINQNQNKSFNYNMSQVRESINKAINLRQSLFKAKEEKKNGEENNLRNSQKDISLPYSNNKLNLTSNKMSDNIKEILFDYTGSVKLDLNKFNNPNQDIKNSESNQEYYLNSMSSNANDNNDIINHENNDINIKDLMNRKTHFNYEIDLEKQDSNNQKENFNYNDNDNNKENIDNNIEDNNTMLKENNYINNNIENNDSNKDSSIIINYNKNYSFGNKDINDNIIGNINEDQSAHFNIDMVNINQKEEKKEEEIPKLQIINNNCESNNNVNMNMNADNKLIDSREDYFFNYRSDVLFNRINMLDTKLEQKNYDINTPYNPPSERMDNPPEGNTNNKIYKIDMQKDYLSNIKESKINENQINNNNNAYGDTNPILFEFKIN